MTTLQMKVNLAMYQDQTLHVVSLLKLLKGLLKSPYKSNSHPEKEVLQVRKFNFVPVYYGLASRYILQTIISL